MTPEQEALLRRAVQGDTRALADLLKQIAPQVSASLHISQTWQSLLDVSDVMQVTYLEAFMQIGRFDAKRPDGFVNWLRRIAENNLRDAIRGLETKKNPPARMQLDASLGNSDFALFDLLMSGVDSPSRAARSQEAADRLRSAIERLPPDYSRTVQLYDLEGKTVEETAAALGRSAGAVFMLRMRAHDRLREFLGSSEQYFESRG